MEALTSQAAVPGAGLDLARRATITDIFLAHAGDYLASGGHSREEVSAIRDILRCRTMALGGHIERCTTCDHAEFRYHSCSNRNCPQCQWLRQVRWSIQQSFELLPVAYHQVVLTLPCKLRTIAGRNKKLVYGLMMQAAAETVSELVQERYGATVGIVVVLHTWNRELGYHPHVHILVSCGGLSGDKSRWVSIPAGFLVPIEDLRNAFRDKLVRAILAEHRLHRLKLPANLRVPGAFYKLVRQCYDEPWIAYVEAPIGQGAPIVKYLSRYVNRIGISNRRLISFEKDRVTFETRKGAKLTLSGNEFIDRYMQHVVPTGFHKIRHYGLYSPTARKNDLERARALVPPQETMQFDDGSDRDPDPHEPWQDLMVRLTGRDPRRCPVCGGPLKLIPFGRPRFGRRRKRATPPSPGTVSVPLVDTA